MLSTRSVMELVEEDCEEGSAEVIAGYTVRNTHITAGYTVRNIHTSQQATQ